ncbi:MAG: NAD(P)H-dependent oxidoreductase subunit E [Myxococcota bacterium]|jgi:formate dehydrogenase subunit gamma|nr:NAD(P)H-dependent oxidoreductase subunit E [Myxococcota bacterium]
MLAPVKKSREPRNLERERVARVLKRCQKESDPHPLAHAVQAALGYLPPHALELLARQMGLDEESLRHKLEADSEILFEPDCARRLEICSGRTCARRGGARLIRQARQDLGIELFETTPESGLRVEPFRCFGQCARAPNIRLDGVIQGAMTEKRFGGLLGLLTRPRK